MHRSLLLCLFFGLAQPLYAAKILLLRLPVPEMKTLARSVEKNLRDHQLEEVVLADNASYEDFVEAVKSKNPDVLALLDNSTIAYAERYLKELKSPKTLYAAATMGLNLKSILKDHPKICGIAFEVPAFQVLTRFRTYAKSSIETVLAPYRKSEFGPSMDEAVQQLAKVQIKLIPFDLDSYSGNRDKLDQALLQNLATQVQGQRIDAILIPTDSELLNQQNLKKVWIRKANELPIPFLCNIESLTQKRQNFCAFAAYPDIDDLGRQFSDQIRQILESGFSPKDLGVEYIASAKDKFNLDKMRALKIEVREESLIEL